MIILMGSAAIVKVNMASGGPKARQAQPKKSMTVIFFSRRITATWNRAYFRQRFSSSCFLLFVVLTALANTKPFYNSKPLYGPDTPSYRAHLSSRCSAQSGTRQIIVPICFTKIQKLAHIGINHGVTRVTIRGSFCLFLREVIDNISIITIEVRDRFIESIKPVSH